MENRDVVVIGASAGGVEALRDLMGALPVDFPAAVLVVLHLPSTGTSGLPHILGRAGSLPVRQAGSGDALVPGTVLVAPPDYHLVVVDESVTLSRGPKENGHRPAIDVLFRTAATALGSRVIGVVLSGALDDGAAGIVAVKLRGGTALVQDPAEALHPSMPRAAMAATKVDYVLPVVELADRLSELVSLKAPADPPLSDLMLMEAAMADLDPVALNDPERPGEPSGWSCPDCHGSLFRIHEGGFVRFRCRIGHAWSPDGLVAQQSLELESALWIALRTLEEKASLTLDLARGAAERGHRLTSQQFERESEAARGSAVLVRDLITRIRGVDELPPLAGAGGAH
jgi:two-component system chemotaxis response regulator CheB